MKTLLSILTVLWLAACAQAPVQQPPPPPALAERVSALSSNVCSDTTARALADIGITAEQIDSLRHQPVIGGMDQSFLTGYVALISLRGQPGSLVINMETDSFGSYCRFRTAYTRDGLQIAGLRSYSF